MTNIVIAIICESILVLEHEENHKEEEQMNLKMRQMQQEIMALKNEIEKKIERFSRQKNRSQNHAT